MVKVIHILPFCKGGSSHPKGGSSHPKGGSSHPKGLCFCGSPASLKQLNMLIFKKQAKKIEENVKFLWITLVFCCYAAHIQPDKLEETERILGLAR
jgi:hypothetical protein